MVWGGLALVGLVASLAVLAWLLWLELVARGFVRVDREFQELRLGRWVASIRRQPDLQPGPCTLPWPHDRCNGWACHQALERMRARLDPGKQACKHLNVTPLASGYYACLECGSSSLTREDLMQAELLAVGQCQARHADTATRCELPVGHRQNHRGVMPGTNKHGTVQWPLEPVIHGRPTKESAWSR